MNKNKIRITENKLKQIVVESVKKVLKETSIDNDSYFGGGLPDKYFDEDEDESIEATPECDGYVVEDSYTGEVISIFRNLNNAIKKCDENYKLTYWGFSFAD